ncbi:hypothetical protein U27_05362 [Candidatus Vecturithrix granuli]|uniref:Uncharacterized protein n=1 Tax=Vecturithrix granuli TaxID=1499967 RepID=A0A081C1D3_VECG1|nr:hypothetical protein U27_05362 [Candidatus Vecturithrix granuli]
MKRIFRNFMHKLCWGALCVLISPFIETTVFSPFLGSQSGCVLAEEGIGVLVELDPATWLELPEFEPQTVTLPCDQSAPSPGESLLKAFPWEFSTQELSNSDDQQCVITLKVGGRTVTHIAAQGGCERWPEPQSGTIKAIASYGWNVIDQEVVSNHTLLPPITGTSRGCRLKRPHYCSSLATPRTDFSSQCPWPGAYNFLHYLPICNRWESPWPPAPEDDIRETPLPDRPGAYIISILYGPVETFVNESCDEVLFIADFKEVCWKFGAPLPTPDPPHENAYAYSYTRQMVQVTTECLTTTYESRMQSLRYEGAGTAVFRLRDL